MATVTVINEWSQTSKTLTRVTLTPSKRPSQYKSFGNKGQRYTVYLSQKPIVQAILESFNTACAETIQKIEKILSQKLDNPAFNKNKIVIDPKPFINEYFASVIKLRNDHKMKGKTTEITGLNKEEMFLSSFLGSLLIRQFFQENGAVVFPVGVKKEQMFFWKISIAKLSVNHSYSYFMNLEQDPVTFTDHQLKRFNMQRYQTGIDPKNLTCFSFALLQAGDKRATQFIFKDFLQEKVNEGNLLSTLEGWGYQSVDNPGERDIVVYFNNNQPTHVGYYTQSGKILSKFGDLNPRSYLHDLFAVPPQYGQQVVFFRSPQK